MKVEDTISRQAAIDAGHKNYDTILDFKSDGRTVADSFEDIINALPSAQQDAIPIEWIEKKIEWLKGLDNEFATLTARNISVMLNQWRGEQYGE